MTNEASKWKKTVAVLGKAGRALGALPMIALGAAIGIALYWGLSPARQAGPPAAGASASAQPAAAGEQKPEAVTWWTCSMHPEIRLPHPGLCPKCGMKLIPLKANAGSGLRVYKTTEAAKALMNIETAPVERSFPKVEIRMVGKVDYDETRLAYITAWVPGRLDRLFVDYTGVAVKKGEHMVYIYSPELYSAQEELLQAIQAVKNLKKSDVGIVLESTKATVDATREKLRLLGMTEEQVADVEKSGKANDHVTIYAPGSGIVIHKNAQEGMYVKTGTRIYTIADLSHVWVKLDAYESDLSWLHYGQKVQFTSVSYPGETFTGKISFIDPILNPITRTVKVRVDVPNPQGKLKPDMFVKAVVHSQVAAGGRVFDRSLAGKWICRMHPDVIEDAPGKCRICGMPLVKAESLGYVSAEPTDKDKLLLIPVSAALVTGTRAIVYLDVDPFVLRETSPIVWTKLIQALRPHRPTSRPASEFANTRCPIKGTPIDPKQVPPELVRVYKGRKVAFCCAGCPAKWDKLDDRHKQQRLAAASGEAGPVADLRKRLSGDLVKQLQAAGANELPGPALQRRFLDEANRLLDSTSLCDPKVWKSLTLSDQAKALWKQGVTKLTKRELHRFNLLLLDQILPGVFTVPADQPVFEGREVVLGPRAGNYYIVRHGLTEGERVVTRGNFKLDSALQIQAKPSMMTPDGGGESVAPKPGKGGKEEGPELPAMFVQQLKDVLAAAGRAQQAAGGEDLDKAKSAFARLGKTVEAVDSTEAQGNAKMLWADLAMRLGNDAFEGRTAKMMDQVKEAADGLAENAASLRKRFGLSADKQQGPAETLPQAFRKQLDAVFAGYFSVAGALAKDDAAKAAAGLREVSAAVGKVDMHLLGGEAHMAWMKHKMALDKILSDAPAARKDITKLRESLAPLSEEAASLARRFPPARTRAYYLMHCPMAFKGRGANWLQNSPQVHNPYFGSTMPGCGDVKEMICGQDTPTTTPAGEK